MTYDMEYCPFCEKCGVQVYKRPSVWNQRSSGKNSLGSGKIFSKSKETFIVQSGCHECGKSQEEIEKWFKA